MSSYGCTNETIDTRSDLEEKTHFNACAQGIVNGAYRRLFLRRRSASEGSSCEQ